MDGTNLDENQVDQDKSQPATPASKPTKDRVVSTNIEHGVVTITHAKHEQPIAAFDVAHVMDKPIGRDLAAYGAAQLLRQAAGGDDPHTDVQKMIDKLHKGDWSPGRKAVVQEVEPVIEALAQHLGKSIEFVTDTYLPRYCQHQGLVTKNGRSMVAAAKAQLSKHSEIAPLVSHIITQRAKTQRQAEQQTPDLVALAA